jgi:U32 family peptidase
MKAFYTKKQFICKRNLMIELLAPAGDLEKLKIALLYGADAVFIGGRHFSLRARASNFDIEDIQEAVNFAHSKNKKVYVTTNIIPHEEDLKGIEVYLKKLEAIQVDAIIVASPAIAMLALDKTKLEVHLSTQQSSMNTDTVNFWYEKGIKRIVLGRELNKHQIATIRKNTKADLEVFIHGGMCMSYSGRCSLSDHMTLRDANRGGCAHSCRWAYTLKQENQTVSEQTFTMSSKDLMAIYHIPDLIEGGVSSLKIEGRMKSLHYIATVVSTYRKIIDDYLQYKKIDDFKPYESALLKAENRLTADGYLNGMPSHTAQIFDLNKEQPSQIFIGIIKAYIEDENMMIIEQRNYFEVGQTVEIFQPSGKLNIFKVEMMLDEDGLPLEVARHPKQIIKMNVPFKVEPYALMRKIS